MVSPLSRPVPILEASSLKTEASPLTLEASPLTLEISPLIFEAGTLTLEAFPFFTLCQSPETSH
jgi:hypothetical protein